VPDTQCPKGSFMDRLFTVKNTVVFNPFNDEMEETIKYLEGDKKVRIRSYVLNRMKAYGFNTPNHPYMFWILEFDQILKHTPKSKYGFSGMYIFHTMKLLVGKVCFNYG
jgi:hypothetical protein